MKFVTLQEYWDYENDEYYVENTLEWRSLDQDTRDRLMPTDYYDFTLEQEC